jgi:uncharacterized protein (TIGR02265 family)
MKLIDSAFVEPPWAAPLVADAAISVIPHSATISGMFFCALVEGAQRRQISLPFTEARYLPFRFYPLRDFAKLLLLGAEAFHPNLSTREGLRRIGKVAPRAFLASTLGKVTLGAAAGVHEAVAAFGKTYAVNVKPSNFEVIKQAERSMVLHLEVPYFLDSHHVGVFEGIMEYAGVRGGVRIASRRQTSAELLLEW